MTATAGAIWQSPDPQHGSARTSPETIGGKPSIRKTQCTRSHMEHIKSNPNRFRFGFECLWRSIGFRACVPFQIPSAHKRKELSQNDKSRAGCLHPAAFPGPSNPLCSQKNTTLTSGNLVEHRGFEPLTSTMRTLRATNCANAPRMIGGFVQTSVETASRNCTARTQREPSFHGLWIVHLARFTVRTKLAEHIIPRPMGECKGCFCKFIEDCMIFPGKT